ncbi:EthD family reductase [Microbacterium album]|uniref:Ethyl tert-butyl ether degradation protein EthD n=1 Tax=Microbacterium album TaxID=2053191 RepID=A0A917IFH0_9MICO|nr:EthD family reductase [Microbacterium album]GGH44698.1 ethyl tert-butyl ether degradation protein EthD [Microbacterium album]
MHKLIVLYPHPADPEAFASYYEGTHLPLAAKLPGMLAWRYTLDVHAAAGDSPYFAIFEADFPDARTLGAALESPEGQAVSADVPNYAPPGTIVLDYEVKGG